MRRLRISDLLKFHLIRRLRVLDQLNFFQSESYVFWTCWNFFQSEGCIFWTCWNFFQSEGCVFGTCWNFFQLEGCVFWTCWNFFQSAGCKSGPAEISSNQKAASLDLLKFLPIRRLHIWTCRNFFLSKAASLDLLKFLQIRSCISEPQTFLLQKSASLVLLKCLPSITGPAKISSSKGYVFRSAEFFFELEGCVSQQLNISSKQNAVRVNRLRPAPIEPFLTNSNHSGALFYRAEVSSNRITATG
jgi:hypothetical protein